MNSKKSKDSVSDILQTHAVTRQAIIVLNLKAICFSAIIESEAQCELMSG